MDHAIRDQMRKALSQGRARTRIFSLAGMRGQLCRRAAVRVLCWVAGGCTAACAPELEGSFTVKDIDGAAPVCPDFARTEALFLDAFLEKELREQQLRGERPAVFFGDPERPARAEEPRCGASRTSKGRWYLGALEEAPYWSSGEAYNSPVTVYGDSESDAPLFAGIGDASGSKGDEPPNEAAMDLHRAFLFCVGRAVSGAEASSVEAGPGLDARDAVHHGHIMPVRLRYAPRPKAAARTQVIKTPGAIETPGATVNIDNMLHLGRSSLEPGFPQVLSSEKWFRFAIKDSDTVPLDEERERAVIRSLGSTEGLHTLLRRAVETARGQARSAASIH